MRYAICLIALLALSSVGHAAQCSLSLGTTIDALGDTEIVSGGCSVRSFEIALHHLGGREAVASELTTGTNNLFRRSLLSDQWALSLAKFWIVRHRELGFHIGAGVWFKEDERYWDSVHLPCHREHDRPHLVSYDVIDTYCENPWVPSPVSLYGALGFDWRTWRLRYAHVSNGGTSRPNLGLDTLQLGYVFVW